MKPFTAEVVGTMLLVLLGDGAVAGCLLSRSKAEKSGWIVIVTGWAMGLAVAVYAVGRISGAHLNPAVTLGLAVIGKFPASPVPQYILAQFIGAFLGATLRWLVHLPHWADSGTNALKSPFISPGPPIP